MTTYNARWEEILPNIEKESIDLLYTDPPYEMNYVSNIPGDKTWCKSGETSSKFESPIEGDSNSCPKIWQDFFTQCYRIMTVNSYLVLHCNPQFFAKIHRFADSKFTYKGMISWNKRFAIGGDIRGAMKRDWEPIVYYAKGKPVLRPVKVMRGGQLEERKRISEIADWDFKLQDSEMCGHPTQKPIALAKQIIELMSDKGQIILDPFAGSGSLLKAAQELDRRFIAIECDKTYFDIMEQRLNPTSLPK